MSSWLYLSDSEKTFRSEVVLMTKFVGATDTWAFDEDLELGISTAVPKFSTDPGVVLEVRGISELGISMAMPEFSIVLEAEFTFR